MERPPSFLCWRRHAPSDYGQECANCDIWDRAVVRQLSDSTAQNRAAQYSNACERWRPLASFSCTLKTRLSPFNSPICAACFSAHSLAAASRSMARSRSRSDFARRYALDRWRSKHAIELLDRGGGTEAPTRDRLERYDVGFRCRLTLRQRAGRCFRLRYGLGFRFRRGNDVRWIVVGGYEPTNRGMSRPR
jgi:hypothetical protein